MCYKSGQFYLLLTYSYFAVQGKLRPILRTIKFSALAKADRFWHLKYFALYSSQIADQSLIVTNKQVTGSCFCDAVQFTIELPTLFYGHCHCSMCRRPHSGRFLDSEKLPGKTSIIQAVNQRCHMKAVAKKILLRLRKLILLFENRFDRNFLATDVPMSKDICHSKWEDYLADIGNKSGMKILEVGSRQEPGRPSMRRKFPEADYTGFDYYQGENVDVVGDAHKLSSYFGDKRFDLIFSNASFEHFAMPWLVSFEIVKLLKPGGIVFIETHFSFSSHERPWHFFQFSDKAMEVLFPRSMGIEVIESGLSNPIVGRFSCLADNYLRNKPVTGLYCHTEFLGRKVEEHKNFDWNKIDMVDVVGEDKYPTPSV